MSHPLLKSGWARTPCMGWQGGGAAAKGFLWCNRAAPRGQDLQPRTQERDPASNIPGSQRSASMWSLNEVSMCPKDVSVFWQTWRLCGQKKISFTVKSSVLPKWLWSLMSEKRNRRMKDTQDATAESPCKIMSPTWELKYVQTNKQI